MHCEVQWMNENNKKKWNAEDRKEKKEEKTKKKHKVWILFALQV